MLCLGFFSLALSLAASASGEAGRVAEDRVKRRLSGLAIPFVANAGQNDPAVAYSAQTFAGTVFVTRDGRIVYSLPAKRDSGSPPGRKASPPKGGWALTETPIGGSACPAAGRPGAAQVNHFFGSDRARWRTGVPTHERVSLGEVWPGISVELEALGENVEKHFRVEPGSDPSKIRMAVGGAQSLRIDDSGALVVGTGLGDVTFTPPVAYQEKAGARRWVEVAYELHGRGYVFGLADYDPALPVLIDPLVQSTYLGGGRDDVAVGVAVHPVSGDVYVAGQTTSTNFPGTAGGAQPGAGGGAVNSIVARLNPALTELVAATYLGAGNDVIAQALSIHPTSGDIYVAGQTSALDFPGTAGGAQPSHAEENVAGYDGFVARLNPALTALIGATYLGGTRDDVATALSIPRTSGEIYVAGWTLAMNFPGTFGGAQPGYGGGGPSDAFLARLNPALTALAQATYLGGDSYDLAQGLAIHPTSGDVYVAGLTTSLNFPRTAGGAQPTHAIDTGLDAFAARLNSALTALVQATYLGGGRDDSALALTIHGASGDVFVAGRTFSTDFPGTAGGVQPASGGGSTDGFLARFNPTLTALGQATYLGGSSSDLIYALAIHPTSGDVYAAGQTFSTDFPGTPGGAQPIGGGGGFFFQDAFVARLNPALTALAQATYFGGVGGDTATSIAIHPISGDVYAAGWTYSTDLPGAAGGAQPTHALDNGSSDAFVARLTSTLTPGGCSADATALCLNNGRFRVQVGWTTPQGQTGPGRAVTLTNDTGYFWFFSANNVEVVVKVVDGRAFNSRFWVFAAGLTNVAVAVTVTDTVTGAVKTYTNPQGVAFQPIQDTNAFVGLEATGESAGSKLAVSTPVEPTSAGSTCIADATTLCLNDGRFQVRTSWTTPSGQSGTGQTVGLTSDTGYFWFFSSNNVEVVVKAVAGCSFNSRYWVFAGGLTNVEVLITVTDTQTGEVRTYANPQGTAFEPIQDTSAFLCP